MKGQRYFRSAHRGLEADVLMKLVFTPTFEVSHSHLNLIYKMVYLHSGQWSVII